MKRSRGVMEGGRSLTWGSNACISPMLYLYCTWSEEMKKFRSDLCSLRAHALGKLCKASLFNYARTATTERLSTPQVPPSFFLYHSSGF